jgi:hypothetical protein
MSINDVNSVSDTSVTEPKWYRDGDAWVKIFLAPIAPGKFKQFDHVYDVPGKNEFPKERWSSAECIDGFHITRRKYVRHHLELHNYKSAYIAEVVSMGDEVYDHPYQFKRRVRVVTFGPAVPLADVLGKHPDDFKNGQMLVWSAKYNHLEMVKLAISKEPDEFAYRQAFDTALLNNNEQMADFLVTKCKDDERGEEVMFFAIRRGRADFVKRLAEKVSIRVRFFKAACDYSQFEIFQLLCTKYGEPKCGDIISPALWGGSCDILKYIKSRGVDMSDFEMLVSACTRNASVNTFKYLVSEGADVKHPLIAYLAKRHPDKEVREFLLAQIDDKSEVPEFENFEVESEIITNSFYIRIDDGEFDGV